MFEGNALEVKEIIAKSGTMLRLCRREEKVHCDGICQYSTTTGLNVSTVSDDRLHCTSGELNDESIQKKWVYEEKN